MRGVILLAVLLAACGKSPTAPAAAYAWAGFVDQSSVPLYFWFGPADSLGGHTNRWGTLQPGQMICMGAQTNGLALGFAWLVSPPITDSMVSTIPVTVPSFAQTFYVQPGPQPTTGSPAAGVVATASNSLVLGLSEPWPC